MNELSIGISIFALMISILSWFLRPIINNKINKEKEKNNAIRQEKIALNNLKEKWLDYFRTTIADYINSCELLMVNNNQYHAYNKTFDYEAVDLEAIKLRALFLIEGGKALASIYSYRFKLSLLFSSKSRWLEILNPILSDLMNYASDCNQDKYHITLAKLLIESTNILEERWVKIENSLKFTEIFD
jgi:hypothetical protein